MIVEAPAVGFCYVIQESRNQLLPHAVVASNSLGGKKPWAYLRVYDSRITERVHKLRLVTSCAFEGRDGGRFRRTSPSEGLQSHSQAAQDLESNLSLQPQSSFAMALRAKCHGALKHGRGGCRCIAKRMHIHLAASHHVPSTCMLFQA